ncbi:MAG: hypothetical protein GH143_06630 [Calditrichaeota bacterium]|nr:hypothetical protein [Calditrichota bacterium]
MKKIFFYIILALVGWSLSCDAPFDTLKDDPSDQTDYAPVNMPISSDSYPSIYCSLPYDKLQEAKAEYQRINEYQVCSPLDQYGWPDGSLTACLSREIIRQEITDEDRMITMSKELLLKNSKFTGVTDTLDLVLLDSRGLIGCVKCDGSEGDIVHIGWRIIFADQVYQGLEVYNTLFYLWMDTEKVYRISGHWYPEIYIPEIDQISPEKTRECLIGTEIVWLSLTGDRQVYTVTSESFVGDAEKIIVSVRDEDSVELRVTCRFGIEYFLSGFPSWYIYVDTSTGETIQTVQLFVT